jgi:cholesterol oxidase
MDSGPGEMTMRARGRKGYRVTAVEAGRRWRPEDSAASPWQAHRLLWAPWPAGAASLACGYGVG